MVLEVEFGLDASGRSAPLRYRELVDRAWGDRRGSAPTEPRARRGAGLARRKGMVLDAADHDTWSVGSFFTNPVVSQADFDRLQGRSDGPVPHFPAPDGVKLAAAWLVEHAGFQKGFPGLAGLRHVVHQALAGADQPWDGHRRATSSRWPVSCATGSTTRSVSR